MCDQKVSVPQNMKNIYSGVNKRPTLGVCNSEIII